MEKKTKVPYLEAKEIQEKENLDNNIENNKIQEKNIEEITEKSSLKRIVREDKDNDEEQTEFDNNAGQEKCGNIRQENYDSVMSMTYENYDNNMGQQNYNTFTGQENCDNNMEELQCKIINDIDIKTLPILFFDKFDNMGEEVTISNGETAVDNNIMENKIEIVSNEIVNDGQYNKKYRLPSIKKARL